MIHYLSHSSMLGLVFSHFSLSISTVVSILLYRANSSIEERISPQLRNRARAIHRVKMP
jgi:hypothetical protein